MKVLIEIPNNAYEWINEHKGVTDFKTTEMLYNRVRDGISLNGTNGDVIKAVFPNAIRSGYIENDMTIIYLQDENESEMVVPEDWWLTEYKGVE